MRFIGRLLCSLGRSPAPLTILLVGCAGLHINSTPPFKGTSADYAFAKMNPNPANPCIPYVGVPGYGYTATTWSDFKPPSQDVPGSSSPASSSPAGTANPEEIPAPTTSGQGRAHRTRHHAGNRRRKNQPTLARESEPSVTEVAATALAEFPAEADDLSQPTARQKETASEPVNPSRVPRMLLQADPNADLPPVPPPPVIPPAASATLPAASAAKFAAPAAALPAGRSTSRPDAGILNRSSFLSEIDEEPAGDQVSFVKHGDAGPRGTRAQFLEDTEEDSFLDD